MSNSGANDPAEQGVVQNIKEYVHLRVDLLKLEIVEKSSFFISLIIGLVVGALLSFFALTFLCLAFAYWMGTIFGSMIPGLLILGGFFILLFLLFYFFRDKLLLNFIVRKITAVFFEDNKNEDDDE